MLTLLAWIVFLGIAGAFAFYRLRASYWVPGVGVVLLIYSIFGAMSVLSLVVLWVVLAGLAAVLFLPQLRMQFVIVPFLKWFRKQQPSLSASEQQVLDAGGLWWEKQIFSGRPNWHELMKIDKPQLTSEEQQFIDQQTSHLCHLLDDWKITKTKDMPKPAWDYIKKEGFWSLIVGKEYGGRYYSPLANAALVTKIASRSMSAAISVMVPNSLGPAELLMHYGTKEQKNYYLPRLAKGEEIPCFGLTALEAGSDATGLKDSGVVCKGVYQDKEIVGIKLNFDKRYITLGPVATVIGLAFKLYDPDHLLGEQTNIGITLALVSADLPGIKLGSRHFPLHCGFQNGPVRGKDVFVPLNAIVGGVEKRGQGWKMLMECLVIGRGISLPSLARGASQLCLRTSSAYCVLRRQFHRSIGQFEGIQAALAAITGYTYLCNATGLFTAQAVKEGARPAVASAIAKYHLTELARKTINHAMDIQAGRAIQLGPNNYLASSYSGIPIAITVEGANILTRNLIIFGQGAMRGHPYLRAELVAAQQDDATGRKEFDRLLLSHVGFGVSCFVRTFVYGLTGGRWIKTGMQKATHPHYQQLTRMSGAFVLLTDLAMAVLGSQLKIKESLSARMGDILSHLYLASSALKYFEDHDGDADEKVLLDWSIAYCLRQVQLAIDRFVDNFPKRWMTRILRWFIFPWRRSYQGPTDHQVHRIAELMQSHSALRDRLTSLCYFDKTAQDPVGRVELAFDAVLQAVPIMQKIQQAVQEKQLKRPAGDRLMLIEQAFEAEIITKQECQQALQAEKQRLAILAVDEFDQL